MEPDLAREKRFDELLDRISKATGPSRELDAAIAVTLGFLREWGDQSMSRRFKDRDDRVVFESPADLYLAAESLIWRPHFVRPYTGSWDAAKTLLPYDCWVFEQLPVTTHHPARFRVVHDLENHAWSWGHTMPLATCHAAVKAWRGSAQEFRHAD